MNTTSRPLSNLSINRLFWYDYVIFFVMLVISIAIGTYYGCFHTKQKTISEYLFGDKKLRPIPVGFSVAIGHISAILLLSIPADTYKYGAYFLWMFICLFLVALISTCVFLPVLYKLHLGTVNEYLEKRFSTKIKILASVLYVIEELIFIPIVIYTPALALSTATKVSPTIIATIMCTICVFYTTIGGLKTVIWTDMFQFLIIMLSITSVAVIGTSQEGFLSVWQKAATGDRLNILDFDLDPTKRDSAWIYIFGYTNYLLIITLKQSAAQKFLSLPSFRDCVSSVIIYTLSIASAISFFVYIGLLIYAQFSTCDPQRDQKIRKHEELVPYYVMISAKYFPGISGLFLVALTCASWSSISCHLNALATVIYHDLFPKFAKVDSSSTIVKIVVAISGIICTGMVVLVPHLGHIMPLMLSLKGITNGPLLGLLTLGVLLPKTNAKGAFYGAIAGSLLIATLVLPAKFYHFDKSFVHPTKELSVNGCKVVDLSRESVSISSPVQVPAIFRISHFYYATIGAVCTIVVGTFISYLSKEEGCVDKRLISPICHCLISESSNRRNHELEALKHS